MLTYWLIGSPMHLEYPVLGGFNFSGGMEVIPELAALVLALSIYTGAFIAEAVRSGIMSVTHGQTEAAYALGLKPRVTLKLVIIPQAMRVIIPQLTSQYLNLTKNSSLATAIGYPDLVNVFAGYHAQPDGTGGRGHRDDHGRVPVDQSSDLDVHELVQQAKNAGGKVKA